jgi:hypothetical protein
MRGAARAIVLSISALALAAPALADPKSEGFKKLTGAQIRRAFPGHTFSDEVHFAFHYMAGGTIEGEGMGKKVSRKWSVVKDELCVTDSFGEYCYAIWRNGTAVKFVIGADAVFVEGFLK